MLIGPRRRLNGRLVGGMRIIEVPVRGLRAIGALVVTYRTAIPAEKVIAAGILVRVIGNLRLIRRLLRSIGWLVAIRAPSIVALDGLRIIGLLIGLRRRFWC